MTHPAAPCPHLEAVAGRTSGVRPSGAGCVECLASGGTWVHLRLCLDCGHVGCCDSSPGRHATAHARATTHPVITSYEPGEAWAYCYPHDAFLERIEHFAGEAASRHLSPPRR
jgi:uncharacterized UBP type Zn finger protein